MQERNDNTPDRPKKLIPEPFLRDFFENRVHRTDHTPAFAEKNRFGVLTSGGTNISRTAAYKIPSTSPIRLVARQQSLWPARQNRSHKRTICAVTPPTISIPVWAKDRGLLRRCLRIPRHQTLCRCNFRDRNQSRVELGRQSDSGSCATPVTVGQPSAEIEYYGVG